MSTTPSARPKRRRVSFQYKGKPGSRVFLAGDFNRWDHAAKPMREKHGDGVFRCQMDLEPGLYEYKFVVDNVWCVDPRCEEWTQNAVGSLNSILRVSSG